MLVGLHSILIPTHNVGSIFRHLFPDHLLEAVVQQTNLYASQEITEQKFAINGTS